MQMRGGVLMAADENRVFMALGALQFEIASLRDDLVELKSSSTKEHRTVHDIVVATSEAVRNLARDVAEMKPPVESYKLKAEKIAEAVGIAQDYKIEQAEKRGAAKFKSALYGLWAGFGALVIFLLGKAWDWVQTLAASGRPPHPVLIALLLVLSTQALAQEHHHPDQTIYGATALFYETWMRPDMPEASCCNKADCDVAIDVKQIGGKLFARKRSGGPLVSIPPEKIEVNRDSPDGESHICAIRDIPLCFIAGSGG